MYDRNLIGTSSEIFGYLRQSSENFRKIFVDVRQAFGTILENLLKSSELLVCLYNKQNNTWTLGDMEFIFSCSHSISHSFAALTRWISMWTLEDKFHISARPCIILYLLLGSCISCYFCFTKLNVSLIIKLDFLHCLNILFWFRDMSGDHVVKIW